jgi:hypothetical protein
MENLIFDYGGSHLRGKLPDIEMACHVLQAFRPGGVRLPRRQPGGGLLGVAALQVLQPLLQPLDLFLAPISLTGQGVLQISWGLWEMLGPSFRLGRFT